MSRLREQLCELKAEHDFETHRGRIVFLRWAVAWRKDEDDADDLYFDPPVRFRVHDPNNDPGRISQELKHWSDEHLDPYWDLEAIDDDPQIAEHNSFWWYGPCYNSQTGEITPLDGEVWSESPTWGTYELECECSQVHQVSWRHRYVVRFRAHRYAVCCPTCGSSALRFSDRHVFDIHEKPFSLEEGQR